MKVKPVLWIAWAGAFAVLEGIAMKNKNPNDTLTGTITKYIPGWMTSAVIGWLLWHFFVSYLNHRDER
jgi:hypothetical protein